LAPPGDNAGIPTVINGDVSVAWIDSAVPVDPAVPDVEVVTEGVAPASVEEVP
jgi:hypothetical protein